MPVDITIVTELELPAIVAALGQERFFRDRLLRQDLGNGELFVAWADATPVGDVYLWRERSAEPAVAQHLGWTPTIQHLEVAAPWRRRGIGTALLHAAQEHAAELGYARVCLGAGVTNPAARRIYERLGYVDWGHGLVDVVGEQTGPDGTLVPTSETCHWLVRSLQASAPGVDDWAAWHPDEVHERLRSSPVDWYVAGGWAVDLWLGSQTREHGDIEVAIDRTDFPTWRAGLAQFALFDVGRGRLRPLGEGDEPDPRHRQVWLCDQTERVWRMDTFLEAQVPGWWTCHWLPLVRHPRSLAVARTASGIPFLRPELVLLGKAKHRRPKDEADLKAVLPTLDDDARDRLRTGLRTADEAHPWLASVGPPAPRSA
jgi:GNAT superfamily N-acetyltransferase